MLSAKDFWGTGFDWENSFNNINRLTLAFSIYFPELYVYILGDFNFVRFDVALLYLYADCT